MTDPLTLVYRATNSSGTKYFTDRAAAIEFQGAADCTPINVEAGKLHTGDLLHEVTIDLTAKASPKKTDKIRYKAR